MAFKLGRKPRRSDTRTLFLKNYLKVTSDPPPATSFWKGKTAFKPDDWGNNEIGDCTFAKQANMFRRFERLETKTTPTIKKDAVLKAYFDLTQRLYGGGDTGAYEEDALSASRNPDTAIRDAKGRPLTIDAFVRVNADDATEIRRAVALNHGIAICINLPKEYQPLVGTKVDLDVPTGSLTNGWEPGSWGGHCLAGNTKISLLRGVEVEIKDLVGSKDIWVYGCLPNAQPYPVLASEVVRTKYAEETVIVHIDSGETIRCTPEHLFMTRDGRYCPAWLLTTGERLMPLNRRIHKGHEWCKWYDRGKKTMATHKIVAAALGIDGEVVHHDDENSRNNEPGNLIPTTQSEHCKIHRWWDYSSTTGQGWFATRAGREYNKLVERNRSSLGEFIPEGQNHKVEYVERAGGCDVFDLMNVSPTHNFAANGVFVHNSMWAFEYDRIGLWLEHTWDLPPQRITWAGVAAYIDEVHVVIDSVDSWRKKLNVGKLISDVNAVSGIKL